MDLFNSNLSIIQEEEIPNESVALPADQSYILDVLDGKKYQLSESAINVIQNRVFHDLRTVFNQKIEEYFDQNFNAQLEALVEARVNVLANSTMKNTSLETSSGKTSIEQRLLDLEEKCRKDDLDRNKLSTKIDGIEIAIKSITTDQKKNRQEFNAYIQQADENLAYEMCNKEICSSIENDNLHKENVMMEKNCKADKINTLEERLSSLEIKVDDDQQYNRNQILELKGIPKQGNHLRKENCYEIVKNFCSFYLNVTVRTYDISIAHRQYNPEEKKKHGKDYIPSIYVKFVNRFLAEEIYNRRYRLKDFRNKLGGRFYVEKNMTMKRKQLWESVEKNLVSYQFKWTRNGDVFVRRNKTSRRIKIVSAKMLDDLIEKQNQDCVVLNSSANDPPQPADLQDPTQPPNKEASSVVVLPAHDPNYPALPDPSPPLLPSPSRRFPPTHVISNAYSTPLNYLDSPTYSHVTNNTGYSYTPYERHQLNLGNRNSLLSPREQMHIHSTDGHNYTRQKYPHGGFRNSRSFSR